MKEQYKREGTDEDCTGTRLLCTMLLDHASRIASLLSVPYFPRNDRGKIDSATRNSFLRNSYAPRNEKPVKRKLILQFIALRFIGDPSVGFFAETSGLASRIPVY